MGTADLKARFGQNRHDLNVSTYQMCILMHFNGPQNATLSFDTIRAETEIPLQELKRHLISLCTPKHRILRKASKGGLCVRKIGVASFDPSVARLNRQRDCRRRHLYIQ